MNYIEKEPHTMVNCECTHEKCHHTTHDSEHWTILEEDPAFHIGLCHNCGEMVTEVHHITIFYDENNHWDWCECGYIVEGSIEEHSPDNEWYYYDSISHACHCSCGTMFVQSHLDEDLDGLCDECSYEIHTCISEDEDHYCDICFYLLDILCTDENNDHICDNVNCCCILHWLCEDTDGNHVCDYAACERFIYEYCTDTLDNDSYCDICGAFVCSHSDGFIYTPLTKTGHKEICVTCGIEWISPCDEEYYYGFDRTNHWTYCYCGNSFDEEEHTFDNKDIYELSFAGHWIYCDSCTYSYFEHHTQPEGFCELCEMEFDKICDVYVGGVGLTDGEYLDLEGNVSDTHPEGGYAYYKDSVLELNNYSYKGNGIAYLEYEDDLYKYYAAIFSAKKLTLKLTGENILSDTYSDTYFEEIIDFDVDGISAYGDLTITGTGTLTIQAMNDGINVDNADFTMESGTLILGIFEEDEDGNTVTNIEIGDDAIDVHVGDVIVKGGTVIINSDDHGFDVDGNVEILGGTVDIISGDDGLNVEYDITVRGGTITVYAADNGFDSVSGSITVTGGKINITTDNLMGLDAFGDVIISGGTIRIEAYAYGIYANHIYINGGTVQITAGMAIYETVTLGNGIEVCDAKGTVIENPDFFALTSVYFNTTYRIGDINLDGDLSIEDVLLLFQHFMLPDIYSIDYCGNVDFTQNGTEDIADALLLFQHSLLPDMYPIA